MEFPNTLFFDMKALIKKIIVINVQIDYLSVGASKTVQFSMQFASALITEMCKMLIIQK